MCAANHTSVENVGIAIGEWTRPSIVVFTSYSLSCFLFLLQQFANRFEFTFAFRGGFGISQFEFIQ